MGKTLGWLLTVLTVFMTAGFAMASDKTDGTVYGFKAMNIDGKMVQLSKYKGKAMIIVNVASRCGHTPQYAGLEKLYETYKDKGLVILGFPCNQFMSQEPGTDKEIKAFCESKYNVKFPMFSKIEVNGDNAHPLYKFLKGVLPDEKGKGDIGWNFTKFLIGRDGKPLKRFSTSIEPEGVEADIKSALKP